MVRSGIYFLSFFISFIFCEVNFTIENNTILFKINNDTIQYPFFGGYNQPKIQWIDWDNDSDFDLFLKDEGNALRYYENIGDSINYEFNLKSTNFNNISIGNWFTFRDFDFDGDFDLVTQNKNFQIGSYTAIMYYKNEDHNFNLITEGLQTIDGELVYSELVSTPTFSDIDSDGDFDFFSGNSSNGSLTFYENIGMDNSLPIFNYVTNFWQEISIIGDLNLRHGASAVTFIDIDNDNDLDLSWGDYFQPSLYIIMNVGNSTEPNMDNSNIILEFPYNDPIQTAGQNMPTFADIDGDFDNDLFVTVLFGAYGTQYVNNFYHYKNNGSFSNPVYDIETSNFLETLDFYSDACPEFADIDNDGDLDLFIGTEIDYSTFPFRGRIKYFKNTGNTAQPFFDLIDPYFLGTNIGTNLCPDLIDIDNDGDLDMFIGEWNGKIKFFENIGNAANFNFNYIGDLEAYDDQGSYSIIDLSGRAGPRFIDIDNDDDFDLFIGTVDGLITYYQNIGNAENSSFSFVTNSFSQIDVHSNAKIDFFDIDSDDDFDLLVGSANNNLILYKNIGNNYNPNFIFDSSLDILNGQNLAPAHGQLFSLDQLDVFCGVSTGGIYYIKSLLCLKGDLNDDSDINLQDIVLVVELILENIIQDEILCNSDLNSDNKIDILDILMIVEIILSS
ncbi:MAG: hypothetical protein CMG07_06775 [Candidatus Marinimicrobia bacterium]|nr:hypothetical protein [Candidatus Neomarinimicrobiota bacterium]|tara:strand:+ start:5052 stop:7061 length:2010 start_codon:yes stop_codon:yes gene_type:complete